MPKLPHFPELRDPATPLERLRVLSALHPEYARALAGSALTPPELLEELARRKEKGVRRALAANPSTPEKLLFKLACAFPAEFLQNPLLTLLALENPDFVEKLPAPTRRALAKHPDTPLGVLEAAVKPFDASVRQALFANPRAPTELLKRFRPYYQAEDSEDRFRVQGGTGSRLEAQVKHALETPVSLDGVKPELARVLLALSGTLELRPREKEALEARLRPDAPPESEVASVEPMVRERMNEALHPLTSRQRLTVLARDPVSWVRLSVARNTSTPPKVLNDLASDSFVYVSEATALNPSTPLETREQLLLSLISDPRLWMRLTAVRASALSPELLERLSTDEDARVRVAIASSAHAPPEILERLTAYETGAVRRALCANPNTPRSALERLLPRATPEMQRLIALHPNGAGLPTVMDLLRDPQTPPQALLELWNVRVLRPDLAAHPNAPLEHILERLALSSDPAVRWLALRSGALHRAVLRRFVRSSRWKERLALAVHPQATYRMLRVLALDPHALVSNVALERLRREHGSDPSVLRPNPSARAVAEAATNDARHGADSSAVRPNAFSSWLKKLFGR